MNDNQEYQQSESGVVVEEAKPELKEPSLFRVLLLNDDYTPMDFVIKLLEWVFMMSNEKAVQIMLEIHNRGKAVCGVYTRDVAETKMFQVKEYAKEHEHPLQCLVEAV